MNKPQTFIFSGISGSGKGTQIALLKKYIQNRFPDNGEYSFVMGDTLRSFMKDDGYAQKVVRSIVNDGKLLPDFITNSLFVSSVLHNLHHDDTLYIDGIPRSTIQSDTIISTLLFYGRKDVFIINIEVSPEEVAKRMKLRNRPDDTEEAIAQRISYYKENVIPAILHLKEKSGFTYIELDGERAIEEIHVDLVNKLKNLL